jgi:hypothetical protein
MILAEPRPAGNLRSPPGASDGGTDGAAASVRMGDMANPDDRAPKAYRHRLHRLKNAYRKAYGREPELERPVTEEAALKAIAFLEEALRRAGVPLSSDEPSEAGRRRRGR